MQIEEGKWETEAVVDGGRKGVVVNVSTRKLKKNVSTRLAEMMRCLRWMSKNPVG
jgi:hypothetical protein